MKKGLNEAVARNIILAQVASDGGKGIDELWDNVRDFLPGTRKARFCGYEDKDSRLIAAIDLINKAHGKSGFSYYITTDPELFDMTLVYFNFRLDGTRWQISFHTYLDLKYAMRKNLHHRTKWDEKNSREAAMYLAHALFAAE